MHPWHKTADFIIRESHASEHMVAYEWVEHVSPELARERMTGHPLPGSPKECSSLKCRGGDLDAVIMLDDDQTAEAIVDGRPVSVVDFIVKQYEKGPRMRVLVGVTPIGNEAAEGAVNVKRRGADPECSRCGFVECSCLGGHRGTRHVKSSELEWAGTGLMFVPSCVVDRLLGRWSRPWWPEPGEDTHLGQGEDIRFTLRCRELGIGLEAVRGLTVWHAPMQRTPLKHFEPYPV